MEAHGGLVSCMVSVDNLVWSCCSDLGTMAAWDSNVRSSYFCLLCITLTYPTQIQKLALHKYLKGLPRLYCITAVESANQKQLWAGSLDNDIYVYNPDTAELLQVLQGHSDYVYCLLKVKDDSVVWSGSRDCTVRQWSFKNV